MTIRITRRQALVGGAGIALAGPPASRPRHRPECADPHRRADHARRAVRDRRAGRLSLRPDGARAAELHGRRPQDRVHPRKLERPGRRGAGPGPQADRAGQCRHHPGPAVRCRGHCAARLFAHADRQEHRQRLVGCVGHDAAQPVAQLLPLLHRRDAVDGGAGQPCPQDHEHRRGCHRRRRLCLPYAQVFGFNLEFCRAGGKSTQYWAPLGTTDFRPRSPRSTAPASAPWWSSMAAPTGWPS